MISGIVSIYLQPLVSVPVAGRGGAFHSLRFVVDTGFAGALALPTPLIQQLNLGYLGQETASQVVGQALMNVYAGSVLWHDETKQVEVVETDGALLLGSELLEGSKLTASFHPGGAVLIEEE